MTGLEQRHDLPRWLCALYDALAALVLFAISYAQRAVAPLAMVSWDEPAWVLRSTRFLLALRSGDWAQTLQTGHPGVTTMWTGALSLNWHRLVTGRVSLAALESAARIRFPEQVQDAAALRELAALLPYAKGGIWLVNALIVVAAYLLLRQLLPRRMAWVAGLALALSPYYTALSRLLHLDALTAGLMLLSLLAALVHLERRQAWAIALSGALAALATLTRSAGLFMAPMAAVLIVWAGLRRPERRVQAMLSAAGIWAAAALATVALAWPAVWVDPLGADQGGAQPLGAVCDGGAGRHGDLLPGPGGRAGRAALLPGGVLVPRHAVGRALWRVRGAGRAAATAAPPPRLPSATGVCAGLRGRRSPGDLDAGS